MKKISLYLASLLLLAAVSGQAGIWHAHTVSAETYSEEGEEVTYLPELEMDTLMPEIEIVSEDSGNGDTIMPEADVPDDSGSNSGTGNNSGSGSNGSGGSWSGGYSGSDGYAGTSGSSSAASGTSEKKEEAKPLRADCTVTSKLAIDRKTVERVLTEKNYTLEELAVWRKILDRLSVSKDTMVFADHGIQYDLTWRDGTTAYLIEEAEEEGQDTVISGSLLPACLLIRPEGREVLETVTTDRALNSKEVKERVEEAVLALEELAGSEETGSEEAGTEGYTTRVPMAGDGQEILSVFSSLIWSMPEAPILYGSGFDVLAERAGLGVSSDTWNTIKAFHLTSDDDSDVSAYALVLTSSDGSDSLHMVLRMEDEDVLLKGYNASGTASFTWHHFRDGAEIDLENTGSADSFRLSCSILAEEEMMGCTRLYLSDKESPAAIRFSTLKSGGERRKSDETEGKEPLLLKDILLDDLTDLLFDHAG